MYLFKKDIFRIRNILPKEILLSCKNYFNNEKISHIYDPYCSDEYDINFNKKYKFDEKKVLNKLKMKNEIPKKAFLISLQRIAKKFRLHGTKKIFYQIHGYKLINNIQYNQCWHYDNHSLYTCVIELQNDFKDRYLDMAYNLGNPNIYSIRYKPDDEVKSYKYYNNSLMCFNNKKGKLLHRVRILPNKINENKKRTILVIVIVDEDWKKDDIKKILD
jgi:hypothetical protein